MHPLFERATSLTAEIIGAAMEVHRDKGAGLIESIYERCVVHELTLRGLRSTTQKAVPIKYKDLVFSETLRFDVLVEGCILLELKSIERVLPVHKAQVLSYMKLLDVPLGLLINFHEPVLKSGISRLILPGANEP